MSLRAIIITILGLACGGFAVMGIQQMRTGPAVAGPIKPDVVPIVVVKSAIPRGHVVDATMVEVRDWPAEFLPESALRAVDQAVERVALTPLIEGEPILDSKLAPVGVGRGAGNLVKPGMRAYSILAANAASSVAGLILPGDRVDVILSVQGYAQDDSGGGTSTTLLQNVEILAIDQELEAPAENRADPGLSTVTLLVTQRQASLLGLGMKAGVLSLALRNPEDVDVAETEPVTLARLRFREEEPTGTAPTLSAEVEDPALNGNAPRKAEVTYSRIRTLRGSHAGNVSIANTERK